MLFSTPPRKSFPDNGYARPRRIFLLDEGISLLSSLLAILLVRWISEPIPGFSLLVLLWLGASALSTGLGLWLTKSYQDVRRYTTVRSVGKVIGAVLVKELLLLLALVLGLVTLPGMPFYVLALLADTILSITLLLGVRSIAYSYTQEETPAAVIEKAARRTALVHGTGAASLALARALEQQEGVEVVGLVVHNPQMDGRVVADYVVYSVSGDDDIRLLQWKLGGVDCVYFPQEPPQENPSTETREEVRQTDGMSLGGHIVKRGFDASFSALLLLIFSPLIGLCAWMVKREDGGPAIYAQERIGRGGKPFHIYKFRSMREDAEAAGSPALYSGEEDPRLTRTGRFLRAHHLDELPQLWNVLRGDMSFIGYRPERSYYIGQIMLRNPRYRYLFQIRPGVTSYATLYNGYTDTLEKMLTRTDLDLYYLRNHSVWFDAKVLWLTFLSIVTGKKF